MLRGRTTTKGAVRAVYESGATSDSLKKLLVEEALCMMDSLDVNDAVLDFPKGFASDLMRALFAKRGTNGDRDTASVYRQKICDLCHTHHGEGALACDLVHPQPHGFEQDLQYRQ